MTIGERIKEKRLEKRMSLEDLANVANVARQTIYKYENNIITNIPTDKIEAIAKSLGVSPGYLMGWENIDSHISYFSNDLGKKVKELRGLTSQEEFSNKCGITRYDLIEIETGVDDLESPISNTNNIIESLRKIANYTNSNLQDLIQLLDFDIEINLAHLPNNKFYGLLSFCRRNEKEAYTLLDYVSLNESDRKSVNDLIEMLIRREMEKE